MKTKRLISIFVCAVCLAISLVIPKTASAAIFTDVDDLQQSQVFGQSSVFDPVGLLVGTDANGDSFVAGSGVFIGNGPSGQNAWILTAGHVGFDEPNLPWVSLRFNDNPDFFGNLGELTDADLFVPFRGFTGSESGGWTGNDIGLVRLSNPIQDVAPAQLFTGSDTDLIGAEFITAGYGNPGVFGETLGAFDGIRRGGRNIIESAGASFHQGTVEDQFFVSDFDFLDVFDPLPLEWQGSQNDSGSPWFVDVNGEYQIAGIVNGSLSSNTDTFAIRTTLYNDFIFDTIASNPPPGTAVPEPGSMSLLTLGLIAMMRRKRTASA